MAGAISFSVAILLSSPPDRGGYSSPVWIPAGVLLLVLIAETCMCVGLLPSTARIGIYSSASALVLCGSYALRVCRMMQSADYLSSKLNGWEVLADNVRMLYCLIFLFLVTVFPLISGPLVVEIIMALCFFILYIIILIREMVESRTMKDTRKATLRRLVRDNIVLIRDNSENINITYRVMYKRLCEYMESNRPFLYERFSIDDLAKALYTNRSYLSKLINTCVHMTYPQFVNNYRVRYSMELFKKDSRLKVSELSELSGFHSTVSYNVAFKLFLGITPGEWCRTWLENSKEQKRLSKRKGEEQ